jgi:hypothetical protein
MEQQVLHLPKLDAELWLMIAVSDAGAVLGAEKVVGLQMAQEGR